MTHTIAKWILLAVLAGMIGIETYQINRYEQMLSTQEITVTK